MSILSDIFQKYDALSRATGKVSFSKTDYPDDPGVAGGFGHFILNGLFANWTSTASHPPQISLDNVQVPSGRPKIPQIKLEGEVLTFRGNINGLFTRIRSDLQIEVRENPQGKVKVSMRVTVNTNDLVPVEVLDWIKLEQMSAGVEMAWNGSAFTQTETKTGLFPLAGDAKLRFNFSRPAAGQWELELAQESEQQTFTLADAAALLNQGDQLGGFLPQSFQNAAAGRFAISALKAVIDVQAKKFSSFELNTVPAGAEWHIAPGLSVSELSTDFLLKRNDADGIGLTVNVSGQISDKIGFTLTGVLNAEAPWEATIANVSASDLFEAFLKNKSVRAGDFFPDSRPYSLTLKAYFRDLILQDTDGTEILKKAGSYDLVFNNGDGIPVAASLSIENPVLIFSPAESDPAQTEVVIAGDILLELDGSTNSLSVKATIPTGSTDPLKFDGELEMDNGIPIGRFTDYLTQKSFGLSLPAGLEAFSITRIGFGLTLTPRPGNPPPPKDKEMRFTCEGALPLDSGLELKPSIDFNYKKEGDNKDITIAGRLLLELEPETATAPAQSIALDLAFGKGAQARLFTASLFVPEDQSVKLKTLVEKFDQGAAQDLPDFTLPIPAFFLAYSKAATPENGTAPKGKLLLGVRPLAGLQFSDLPLVGNALPAGQEIGVSNLLFLYSGADFENDEINNLNGLLREELQLAVPEDQPGNFKKGLSISGKAVLGAKEIAISLPIGKQQQNGGTTRRDASAPGVGSDDKPGKWFKVARRLGPLYISRVGFVFPESRLTLMLEAELTMGPLTLSLLGFSIGSKLDRFDPVPGLEGFGLRYDKPPVEISALFLKIDSSAPTGAPAGVVVKDRFAGTAVVKTKKLSISALGEYANTNRGPSFYLYAYIGYPLGGPAFFFVEGLALGFGFNRSVRFPAVSEINRHPFVAIAMERDAGPLELAVALIEGNYIPITPGKIFLAVGIRFTTFKILDSFALIVAGFGNPFRLDLMGVSKLVLPPRARETGAPVLAEITLNLKGAFVPEEGFFGLAAQLSADSYVLSRACKLQGGFAFYSWFSGRYGGDFVLTLGGYHPRYRKPAHYPDVPRLGFYWQISGNLSIKGAMYFALTPSAVMAGGSLEATWKSGGLKAWFIIAADFLISWKPFFYDISMRLQFGVSYTFWFFGKRTIKVQLGAGLRIWGPEFAGIATIDIGIISFDIAFGSQRKPVQQPLPWNEFRQSFLPQRVISMNIVSGLIKETEDGAWVVDPDFLAFEVSSLAPSLQITAGDKDGDAVFNGSNAPLGAGPMCTTLAESSLSIHLDELEAGDFSIQEVRKSYPAAVWGVQQAPKPELNRSNQLVKNALAGILLTVRPPDPPDNIAGINAEKLAFNEDLFEDDIAWAGLSAFQKDAVGNAGLRDSLLSAFGQQGAGIIVEDQIKAALDLTLSAEESVLAGAY